MRRLSILAALLFVLDARAAFFLPLGDLAGAEFGSRAHAVSADGSTVVGQGLSDSGFEAFRWTRAGGMVGLGDLPGDAFYSDAYAVSADGSVVVGYSRSASGTEAFRWTSSGGMVGLGDLPSGSFDSQAYGVSADGSTVVGDGNSGIGVEAFVWDFANGMRRIDPSETLLAAQGVSADGLTIVGGYGAVCCNSFAAQAFRWTSTSGTESLGNLGGFSSAIAVSADGSTVVGGSGLGGSTTPQAFRWTSGGGIVSLGQLPGGSMFSEAVAVSADGSIVVGDYTVFSCCLQAFIWDAAHGMRKLDQVLAGLGLDLTGWTLVEARGISADGTVIVGTGTSPTGQQEAWLANVAPACSDGIDNDGDGLIDYPNDPGCSSATSTTESPACQDGIDNDGDGGIDFDGGASANHGVALGPPDLQCGRTPYRDFETTTRSCGLGAELAMAVPLLMWLRARRRMSRAEAR